MSTTLLQNCENGDFVFSPRFNVVFGMVRSGDIMGRESMAPDLEVPVCYWTHEDKCQ